MALVGEDGPIKNRTVTVATRMGGSLMSPGNTRSVPAF